MELPAGFAAITWTRHAAFRRWQRRWGRRWGQQTAVPLFLFVLAALSFWRPLMEPSRIAIPVDSASAVSAPWNAFPARFQPQGELQGDVVALLLPERTFVRAELAAGRFPLWNPYALGGTPLWGNAQSAVFGPLGLATLPLPLTMGWAVLAVATRFFAALGVYCHAHTLGARRLVAGFAAVAFVGVASLVNWRYGPLGTVALCLPWLLFALERLITASTTRDRAGWALFLAGVTATHVFHGQPETSLHLTLAAAAYAVFRTLSLHHRTRRAGSILLLASGATVLGVALAAVQLLPAVAIIGGGTALYDRADASVYHSSTEYRQLWSVPFLIWPLLLLALALLRQPTRRHIVPRVGGTALLLALLADLTLFGAHRNPDTGARLLFPETPTLTRLRMESGNARIAGTLDTLRPNAATALQLRDLRGYELMVSTEVTRYLRAAVLITAANGQPDDAPSIPLLAVAGVRFYVGPHDRPVFTQGGDAVEAEPLVAGREETQWFIAPTDGLSAVEIFMTPYGAHGDTPAALTATFSDTTGRVLGRDTQPACERHERQAGCPVRFALPAPLAHSGGYGYAITLTAPAATDDTAVGLWYAPLSQNPAVTAGRLIGDTAMPGALAFRLFASPGAGMTEAWDGDGITVWKVPGAQPRAYFAGAQTIVPDPGDALAALRLVGTTPDGVVVARPLPAVLITGGSVTTVRDVPGDVTLYTEHAGGNGLLVLNESAAPGWRATIDGVATLITTVNSIAQGIVVPAGAHTVRFRYLPTTFIVGAAISGGAGILTLVLLALWWRALRLAPTVLLPLPVMRR